MDRDKNGAFQVLRKAPKALTVTAIAGLRAGQTLADGAIRPGLGSLKIRRRATTTGTVIEWLFEWSREAKTARQSLGRYSATDAPGALTMKQARDEARRLQDLIKNGENPLAKRELEREARRIEQATVLAQSREAAQKTFGAMLDAYVASLKQRDKADSAYDAGNIFKNHVQTPFPDLWALPGASISPEHISRILTRLVGPDVPNKKGRTAVKLRSYMAAAFALALGASLDPMSPSAAAGFGVVSNAASAVPVKKMASSFNKAGERVLSTDEFRHFLAYLAVAPSTLPRLVLQLQVATGGQRLQQLLRLRHANIGPDTLTLFDPKGKRTHARAHVLPMTPEISEVLTAIAALRPTREDDDATTGELPAEEPDEIFASASGAVVVPESLSTVVREISDAMLANNHATQPFRAGDIRRTIETMMAGELRISKDVRAQLLSHGLTGVQDRHYDKGQHLAAKAAALRQWNAYVADTCIGTPAGDNVVGLASKRSKRA
ncbi:hypothetical protein ACIPRI_12630 [Variovorax sp. LARHSF232]